MSSWITAAEAALAQQPSVARDGHDDSPAHQDADHANHTGIDVIDVVERYAPAILDAVGLRALLSPFFAGFVAAAAVLREVQTHEPLDPLALLLRLLTLALALRAVLLLTQLMRRLRVRLSLMQYGLALSNEGLLYRSPSGDTVVPKTDVLDVREHGDWRQRSGRRFSPVYIVTRPESGRSFVAFPPVFERTPGVLSERLMRWLGTAGVDADDAPVSHPEPTDLATKLWERAARAERMPNVSVIRSGNTWLGRGPFASALLGLAVLDGFLRLPSAMQRATSVTTVLLLGITLFAVPLAWWWLSRADQKRRGGIALLLTPSELLLRTRAGIHRTRWSSVTRAGVETQRAWSLLQGAHDTRNVVVRTSDGQDVRYAEALLGVPAEVAAGLCEAYRKGAFNA